MAQRNRPAAPQMAENVRSEKPVCPITGYRETRCIGTWSIEDLCRLRKEDIGIDTSSFFTSCQGISLWHAEKSDLQFFHPIVIGNKPFYEQLRAKPWYFQPDKWEFQEAARHIAVPDLVLDLGAGRQPIGAFVAPNRYVAVDPLMDESAAAKPQRKFDVVCAFQVLEHVADPLGFIAIAKSWLKPGGLLFVGVPNRESYLKGLRDFALDMPPHHVSRWSEQALASLAQSTHLTVEAIAKSPLEPWEASLYWMTRLERGLPRPATGRYRLSRVIAYGAAHCFSALLPSPRTVAGGSLLLRARRD